MSKVTKAWPTSCCCEQTPVCCRICQFRAAPSIQGLQEFRRPNAAASIHMCVAEITPAPRGRNFIRASPTNCCCEHRHVGCRMSHLRVAPGGQGLQGFARPLAVASMHMCVAKITQIRAAPKGRNVTKGPRSGAAVFTCPGSICSATHLCMPPAAFGRPSLCKP